MSIVISSNSTYNNPNITISADNKTSGVNVNSYQIIEREQSQDEVTEERDIVTRVFGHGFLSTPAGLGYPPNYVHSAEKPLNRYDYLLTTLTISLAYDYVDSSGNKPYENLKYANKKDISVSITQTGTKSGFVGENSKNNKQYDWTKAEQDALNTESKYYQDGYASSLQKIADIIENEVEDMTGKMTYKTAEEEVENILSAYEYIGSRKKILSVQTIIKYDNRISITIKFVSKVTHVIGRNHTYIGGYNFVREIIDFTFNKVKVSIKFNYKKPEKIDFEHTIGDETDNVVDSDESFLYHEGNYINDNIDIYNYNANKIIEEYKNGRQVISMEVPVTQYFDENGNRYFVNSDNELLLDAGNHLIDSNGDIKYTLKDLIVNSGIKDITPQDSSSIVELIGNSEKIIALGKTSAGFTGNNYFLSEDGGETWNYYEFPEIIKNAEIKMDFGYGMFAGIAFDYNGDKIPYLFNSYNGVNWNVKTLDITSNLVYTQLNGFAGIKSIVSQAGVGDSFGYYLVDGYGRLYKSRTKTTLDNIDFLLTIANGFYSNSISFGNFGSGSTYAYRFIVVGNNGSIYVADTGSPYSFSDWTKITSGTSSNLNSVCVGTSGFTTLRFVAVGNNGTILNITNNSTTATVITSPTTNNLRSIVRTSQGLVAVGDSGTIIYSTDLGRTFNIATSPTNENLKSVSFYTKSSSVSPPTADYFLAVGENGTVIYSTDMINWQLVSTDTTETLNTVAGNLIYGNNATALKFNQPNISTSPINPPDAYSSNNNLLYSYWLAGYDDIIVLTDLQAFTANVDMYFTPTLRYANYNFFFFDDKIIYISKDGMNYEKYNSNISGTNLDIIGYMNGLYVAYDSVTNNKITLYTSPDLQNWTTKVSNFPSGFSPKTYLGRITAEILNDVFVIYGVISGSSESLVNGSLAIAYSTDLTTFTISQLEETWSQSYIAKGVYNRGVYTLFAVTPDNITIYMSKSLPEFDIVYGLNKTSISDALAYYNNLLVLADNTITKLDGLGTFSQALNLLDKFPLAKGMICLPMYRHNGENIPIITNKRGDGKKFIIISSDINYTGNLMNSITMEEDVSGNNESVKYLTFNKGTNTIEGITIPANIQYFELNVPSSIDNVDVYNIANGFATNNTKIYTLELPFTIMVIGDNAFYGCSGISNELELPYYLTTIGQNAFRDCSGLKGNIIIPEKVVSIGESAFQNCTGLNGFVSFPQSIKSFSANVLNGCSNLEYIILNSDTVESSSENSTAFDNTGDCPIYVPDEGLALYKSVLTNYSSRIKSMSEIL